MEMDAAINADNKEQLQVADADDSYSIDFIEVAPFASDTDGSCTTEITEYVGGDLSAEVKQENLAVVKQEPDDVCLIIYDNQFVTTQTIMFFKVAW